MEIILWRRAKKYLTKILSNTSNSMTVVQTRRCLRKTTTEIILWCRALFRLENFPKREIDKRTTTVEDGNTGRRKDQDTERNWRNSSKSKRRNPRSEVYTAYTLFFYIRDNLFPTQPECSQMASHFQPQILLICSYFSLTWSSITSTITDINITSADQRYRFR